MFVGMSAGDGYDIFSPEYRSDPWGRWAAVRRAGCPLARSDAWGGSWLPVRYDDIRDIGRDAEHYTSRATEVAGPVAVADFAQPLTLGALTQLLGVPEADADRFVDWMVRLIRIGGRDQAVRAQTV